MAVRPLRTPQDEDMPPMKYVDQVSDVVADLGGSATVAKIACHLKWDESKVVDISRGPRVRT